MAAQAPALRRAKSSKLVGGRPVTFSRAAFSRTVREALGQTTIHCLTDWRMALARDHLRTGNLHPHGR
ncbi:hypothetical protein JHN63_42600 [Streptomyces sp. MBT65]|uniref:hypothetical protein n=1 Tax=Streptomyces sp. MBT65 TaxID=1488395 RepID=UPI00190A97D7|nr:hypothetical protein [Streptomyces sp. MBT65]MBK3580367.1 hypothetical protein [Streptomyces sp. MBT65]